MDNFIQELEEDLRRDRYMALWQKYGRFAVALALLVVIAVAGWVMWRHYQTNQRFADSMAYNAALLAAESGPEAGLAALGDLAKSGGETYALLARLQQAALMVRGDKQQDAVAMYDAIAADSAVAPMFRDLATVLRVQVLLDSGDPAELTGRLAPLTGARSAWRYTALELTALLALRADDKAKARELYTTLADDPTTPRQMRGRAAEMLGVLGAQG